MEPMVSARVPLPLRNRVNERLKEMGSSPTELINKAYSYVDATGSLPHVQIHPKPGKRKLDEQGRRMLGEFFDKTTYPVPEEYFAGRSYDEILRTEMRRKYEALP